MSEVITVSCPFPEATTTAIETSIAYMSDHCGLNTLPEPLKEQVLDKYLMLVTRYISDHFRCIDTDINDALTDVFDESEDTLLKLTDSIFGDYESDENDALSEGNLLLARFMAVRVATAELEKQLGFLETELTKLFIEGFGSVDLVSTLPDINMIVPEEDRDWVYVDIRRRRILIFKNEEETDGDD